MMERISYTVAAQGDSTFFNSFAIPLAAELERLEGKTNIQHEKLPKHPIFEHDARPKAYDLVSAGIFGVLLFLPGWFAVKVLDEIYDIKIRPVVRNIIRKADSIDIFSSKKRYKVFTLSIFHKEINVLVIVAAKEESLKELEVGIKKLPEIHSAAGRMLQVGNYAGEVHLYILSKGEVNVKPFIHENLESAHNQLNT